VFQGGTTTNIGQKWRQFLDYIQKPVACCRNKDCTKQSSLKKSSGKNRSLATGLKTPYTYFSCDLPYLSTISLKVSFISLNVESAPDADALIKNPRSILGTIRESDNKIDQN
jgi:hypothetical protein